MGISNLTSKILTPGILSRLDSSSSFLPIMIKEGANITGRTTMAQNAGGEHEAREKFIEEAGTSALWLGGIPLSRTLFDAVAFKPAGLNPDISIKVLPDIKDGKVIQSKPQQLHIEQLKDLTRQFGKTAEEKLKNLSDVNLVKKYKNMHIAKILVSTLVPFALLTIVLPKLNQQYSKKVILNRALKEKEAANKQEAQQENTEKILAAPLSFEKNTENKELTPDYINLKTIQENFEKNTSSKMTFAKNNKQSFTGIGSSLLNMAAGAQISPVDNMKVLDGAITGSRLTYIPRNNQERVEYGVKEGGLIFFFFFAQKLINKGFNAISKGLGTPTALDFKTLGDDMFVKKMKDYYNSSKKENSNEVSEKLKSNLTQFTSVPFEEKTEKLSFFNRVIKKISNSFNPKNEINPELEKNAFDFIKDKHTDESLFTLQQAKKLGIIKTAENKLDQKNYVEISNVKELSQNLGDFAGAMLESKKSPEKFIKNTKRTKTALMFANLAICSAALGYVLPKIQYLYREKVYGSKAFPGTKAYEEEAKRLAGKA